MRVRSVFSWETGDQAHRKENIYSYVWHLAPGTYTYTYTTTIVVVLQYFQLTFFDFLPKEYPGTGKNPWVRV